MTVDPRLSRLVAVSLAPVLLVQARRLRGAIPVLPDAAFPWNGEVEGPDPVRLLVLGDSTAAGVGVDTQSDALPGNLGRAILANWGRGSRWTAVGQSGGTAKDIVDTYLDSATGTEYDLVFLSIGANDAIGGRSARAFQRDIRTILRRIRATSPRALVLVSSLPAFFRFESLPNPLRWTLYLHARSLELAARQVVRNEPGVVMSPPPPPYTPGFFASDRFHPSAAGYRDWVEFAVTDLIDGAASPTSDIDVVAGAEATGLAPVPEAVEPS